MYSSDEAMTALVAASVEPASDELLPGLAWKEKGAYQRQGLAVDTSRTRSKRQKGLERTRAAAGNILLSPS